MRRFATALLALGGPPPGRRSATAEELRLTPVGTPRFPDRSYVPSLPSGEERAVGAGAGHGEREAGSRALGVPGQGRRRLRRRGARDRRQQQHARGADRRRDGRRTRLRPPAERRSSRRVSWPSTRARTRSLPLTTDAEQDRLGARRRAAAAAPNAPLRRRRRRLSMLPAEGVTRLDRRAVGRSGHRQPGRARARRRNARARPASASSAVGLRSNAFEPDASKHSRQARGSYTEASTPATSRGSTASSASTLANEHLIQYSSLAAPRAEVLVRVEVLASGTAT